MRKDLKADDILKALNPSLGKESQLKDILPEQADTEAMSAILGRELVQKKSTRDYALFSFSSLYEASLPFMRAGQETFYPGEAALLKTLLKDLRFQKDDTKELLLACAQETARFKFKVEIEQELFARIFLKTSGLDSFEELFIEALGLLREQKLLKEEDEELLKEAYLHTERAFQKRQVKVINPLQSLPKQSEVQLDEDFYLSHEVKKIEEKAMDFELLTPILKDFVLRLKEKSFSEDSLGLSAFSPFLKALSKSRVLGIVKQIENGALKSFSLVRLPDGESSPPVYGPFRTQLTSLLFLSNSDSVLLNNLDLKVILREMKRNNQFLSVDVLGGVAVPKNKLMAYEEAGKNLNPKANRVTLAAETYVLKSQSSLALALDPVSVPFRHLEDQFSHFELTRFTFFVFNPIHVLDHYQGALMVNSGASAYQPAALDSQGRLAGKILKESFGLISQDFGQELGNVPYEDALEFLREKYPLSLKDLSEAEIYKKISAREHMTFGLSEEIYSLFYQSQISKSPLLALAATEAPRFLASVRLYPQRFKLSRFLSA